MSAATIESVSRLDIRFFLEELIPWFLLKAIKIPRYGTKEAVKQIMTLLFDEDKTEEYYERFHTRRKIKK